MGGNKETERAARICEEIVRRNTHIFACIVFAIQDISILYGYLMCAKNKHRLSNA